jgi:hypothetical protein
MSLHSILLLLVFPSCFDLVVTFDVWSVVVDLLSIPTRDVIWHIPQIDPTFRGNNDGLISDLISPSSHLVRSLLPSAQPRCACRRLPGRSSLGAHDFSQFAPESPSLAHLITLLVLDQHTIWPVCTLRLESTLLARHEDTPCTRPGSWIYDGVMHATKQPHKAQHQQKT